MAKSATRKFTIFKGKKIYYTNITNLATKLNISKTQASEIVRNEKVERLIVTPDGDIDRINVKKKLPLLLQDFNIGSRPRNKKLLGKNEDFGMNKYFKEIPANRMVKIVFGVDIRFTVSNVALQRRVTGTLVDVKPKNIMDAINEAVDEYLEDFTGDVDNLEIDEPVITTLGNKKLSLINNKLREENPIEINNTWENLLLNPNRDCVKTYLKRVLRNMSGRVRKEIDEMGDEDGVTPAEIIEFCKHYNLEIYIYHHPSGNIYAQYKPEKRNTKYSILRCVTYNNHLYPVPIGEKPKKKKHTDLKICVLDDVTGKEKLDEFLNNKIEPANIKTDGDRIISFIVGNTKYIDNKDYNKCLKILKIYGKEDNIYDSIGLTGMLAIIEKKFMSAEQIEKLNSFLPNNSTIRHGGYTYLTTEEFDEKKVKTIDKNKLHSNALHNLPCLISTDYRTNKIIKDPKEIIDNNFYIARPEKSSILMQFTDEYTGYFLKYCKKEGLKFKLLEEMTCESSPNYFREIVIDMYNNIDNSDCKDIINRGIGLWQKKTHHRSSYNVRGVYNNVENDCYEGFKMQIGEEFSVCFTENQTPASLYNRRLIAKQVQDESRKIMYEKMKKMKLSGNKIVQLKYDALSYLDGEYPDDLNDDLHGWKKQDFRKLKSNRGFYDRDVSFLHTDNLFDNNNNTLYDAIAGTGKTYYSINEIIPKIIKDGEDYIVLCPSHDTIEEYREEECNNSVIQTYGFKKNIIPTEKNIIVDEFFMCDKEAHDLVIKCALLGKNIYCLGDPDQLNPPGQKNNFSSKHYLAYLFGNIIKFGINRRNNFTLDYYDEIKQEKINIIDEVKKYSKKKYYNAEMIICYRRKTVDKYNKLMMEHLGLNNYDVGLKLRCITNELRDKNMFNRFCYEIIESDGNKIKLNNDEVFTKKQIDKYFKPAYAKTIYGVQGKSLKSYFYAPEDYDMLDGRRAYTVISRLKTK